MLLGASYGIVCYISNFRHVLLNFLHICCHVYGSYFLVIIKKEESFCPTLQGVVIIERIKIVPFQCIRVPNGLSDI